MFTIGGVELKNRIISAPMAGVTDKAYRLIARSFGCGLVYSEMISDMGLVYGQDRTRQLASLEDEEPPVAVQIFGSEAEPMVTAARMVERMGASIIDINMGCPTPKIVKNGEGAALMLNPDKARRLIREVRAAITVPLTVKMRKGWDDDSVNCLELAGIAEAEGASAVTIHGRTRSQFYAGEADWDVIRQIKGQLKIPVIGNGDIWTADDARRMLDYTGCDAVMIARGAMGNPFIFREAVELVENGVRLAPAGVEERIETAIKHLDLTCRFKGEAVAVREMRKHFSWYLKGTRGAARIREQVNRACTRADLVAALSQVRPRINPIP